MYKDVTDKIKQLEALPNQAIPLTSRQLSNPHSGIVQIIIGIYTMETFIYREMNKASREQDLSKIKFYGPLAAALGFIIQKGNLKAKQLDAGCLYLFRGFQESQEIIDAKYN